jgi:hypothetical protein
MCDWAKPAESLGRMSAQKVSHLSVTSVSRQCTTLPAIHRDYNQLVWSVALDVMVDVEVGSRLTVSAVVLQT